MAKTKEWEDMNPTEAYNIGFGTRGVKHTHNVIGKVVNVALANGTAMRFPKIDKGTYKSLVCETCRPFHKKKQVELAKTLRRLTLTSLRLGGSPKFTYGKETQAKD